MQVVVPAFPFSPVLRISLCARLCPDTIVPIVPLNFYLDPLLGSITPGESFYRCRNKIKLYKFTPWGLDPLVVRQFASHGALLEVLVTRLTTRCGEICFYC